MDENINQNEIINEGPYENIQEAKESRSNPNMLAGAILVAGIIIAGAILLRGTSSTSPAAVNSGIPVTSLAPISKADRTQGNPKAKVAVIMYEDFQCPFCGAISGLTSDTDAIKYLKQNVDPNWAPFMPLINDYVKAGSVQFAYRDFPFLGTESVQSAEAARCAEDQNKFWEYHDYLYGHQNGENKGAFSDANLKSFAKVIGLDTNSFNTCLDGNKYAQAVADSKAEGMSAGVTATPKGFILRDGKIVDTIDGAIPASAVKQMIDAALK